MHLLQVETGVLLLVLLRQDISAQGLPAFAQNVEIKQETGLKAAMMGIPEGVTGVQLLARLNLDIFAFLASLINA